MMTQQLEYTQRLCVDGPHEGTFVRMHSKFPGTTVTFPSHPNDPPCVYKLQEDGSLSFVEKAN